jgi:hypothetical protein
MRTYRTHASIARTHASAYTDATAFTASARISTVSRIVSFDARTARIAPHRIASHASQHRTRTASLSRIGTLSASHRTHVTHVTGIDARTHRTHASYTHRIARKTYRHRNVFAQHLS